jgi:hypothetical protein
MRNKFRDSWLRVNWAKKDFTQFKRTSRRFFNSKPHVAIAEMDDKGIYELHKIKLARPLPDSLGNRVLTTLEHLRSALDLTAYAVAVAAHVATDQIHFPFCATASDFKSRFNSACKNLPQEIYALFEGFKPYRGGDDLLWALNELCKGSKHRIIAPFGMTTGPVSMTETIIHGPSYIPPARWDAGKEELIYLATAPGVKSKYKVQVSFDVTFREVDVVKGRPVVGVLDALIIKVKNIVAATETVCGRRFA